MKRLTGVVLLAMGVMLTLIALAGSVLIVDWLRHPGGIGMEWFVVPIVGLLVMLCVSGAVIFVRLARRNLRSAPDH